MAKYKKRPDGRYQANIQVGVDEETGKIKYKTIYAKSVRDLEDKKAEVRQQLNTGCYADDRNMALGDWADKWFRTHKSITGIRTQEMYHSLVYTYIIPSLGDIRLRDLTKSDIQLLINDNQEHFRTCQMLKMCMNQIIESAIDDGLLYKNVNRNINLPVKIKKEKRALTDIEKQAIEKADLSPNEKSFLYIIQYAGLRKGEALALMKNDIDFKQNVIHVRNAITYQKNKPIFKPMPKSQAGIREVPMPTILSNCLKQYVSKLDRLQLFECPDGGGFMTSANYDTMWDRIIRKLNIAAGGTNKIRVIHGLTAHIFRHNYATMLFYSGVDVKEAQNILGHSDVNLTLNIYTHMDKQKTSAASKLNNFLENKTG